MVKPNFIEEEHRDFGTRLKYIQEVFSHKFTQEEIMKISVTYRLNISYEKYLESLNESVSRLRDKNNPTSVLKRAEKEQVK